MYNTGHHFFLTQRQSYLKKERLRQLYITVCRHLRVDFSFTGIRININIYMYMYILQRTRQSLWILAVPAKVALCILTQPFRSITTGQDGLLSAINMIKDNKNPPVQVKKRNMHCYKLSSKRLNLLSTLHRTVWGVSPSSSDEKRRNIHCYKLSSKQLNLLFMLHRTVWGLPPCLSYTVLWNR